MGEKDRRPVYWDGADWGREESVTYCAADPEDPPTMRGEPSRAWHADHPGGMNQGGPWREVGQLVRANGWRDMEVRVRSLQQSLRLVREHSSSVSGAPVTMRSALALLEAELDQWRMLLGEG